MLPEIALNPPWPEIGAALKRRLTDGGLPLLHFEVHPHGILAVVEHHSGPPPRYLGSFMDIEDVQATYTDGGAIDVESVALYLQLFHFDEPSEWHLQAAPGKIAWNPHNSTQVRCTLADLDPDSELAQAGRRRRQEIAAETLARDAAAPKRYSRVTFSTEDFNYSASRHIASLAAPATSAAARGRFVVAGPDTSTAPASDSAVVIQIADLNWDEGLQVVRVPRGAGLVILAGADHERYLVAPNFPVPFVTTARAPSPGTVIELDLRTSRTESLGQPEDETQQRTPDPLPAAAYRVICLEFAQ